MCLMRYNPHGILNTIINISISFTDMRYTCSNCFCVVIVPNFDPYYFFLFDGYFFIECKYCALSFIETYIIIFVNCFNAPYFGRHGSRIPIMFWQSLVSVTSAWEKVVKYFFLKTILQYQFILSIQKFIIPSCLKLLLEIYRATYFYVFSVSHFHKIIKLNLV